MIAVGSHVAASVDEATGRAADIARGRLGAAPAWALAFVGGQHDGVRAMAALRSALDGVPVFGGTAPGVMTRDDLGYGGYEVAVALFEGPVPRVERVERLDQGEREAGRALGRKLAAGGAAEAPTLLLYDSVRRSPPPVLNVGSHLMDGLNAELPEGRHLWGAGVLADLELTRSLLFDGDGAVKQAAVALVLEGYRVDTVVMHGCEPVSAPMRITDIDGPVVKSIDGCRALDVILETAGLSVEAAKTSLSLWVTLGAFHPGPQTTETADLESQYVNRLVLDFDEAAGTVTLFEADFRVGDEVQIMHRDNQSMIESAARQTKRLLRHAPAAPELFMYIDCAGRCQAFSGAEEEEAEVVRRHLPGDVPLLGFYSGVEIAPVRDRSRPLDWTGVLSALSRA